MESEQHLISLQEFCTSHQIEVAFITSLYEYGLVKVTTIQTTQYIYPEQLKDLEKMIRFHYDLGINFEGIHAISLLLQRLDHLHEELNTVKNRLNLYEVQESGD